MEILYFVVVILLIIFKKSKWIWTIALVLLWLLFAFNTDNIDRGIYISRLDNYYTLSSQTEFFFTLIMNFLSTYHIDIQYLYLFTATFFLVVIYKFGEKNSKYFGLALAGYMIAIFFRDVVQLRFTMALIFVYIGVGYHIKITNNTHASLLFSLFIIMASLIHGACVVFLLFILARYIQKNRSIFFAIVLGSLFLLFAVYFSFINKSLAFFQEKTNAVTAFAENHGSISYSIKVLSEICIMVFFWIYSYKKFFYRDNYSCYEIWISDYMYKINILSMSILPMLFLTVDFHRIFHALFFLNMTIISRWLTNKNKLKLTLYMIALSIFIFRTLSVGGNKTDGVFYSILNNNLLY